jgi:hypothetical protein
MRITSIKISQKVNTGKYESLDFEAEAVLGEEDAADNAAKQLADFVDWHAQKPLREERARNYRKVLKNEQATEAQRAEAEIWLGKYEQRRQVVEAM